jgi:hypothetical protein|nr:MAG TPA: DNA damage inducible protein-like protein [Caudoviricetes sp.]
MKRLLVLLLLILVTACYNKKDNTEHITYFENSPYTECKVPVIKKELSDTALLFIIDTGANISILDEGWYSNHRDLFTFIKSVETSISGIGGVTIATQDIVTGDFKDGSVTFITSNLEAVRENLKSRGYNIVGIIGSDYFEQSPTIIDYGNRAIYSSKIDTDSIKFH